MVDTIKLQRTMADELMRLRYEKDLTAVEVAKKAGIHVGTVFKYEFNHVQSMNTGTLAKLLEVYGVPLDIFFHNVSAKTQKSD